MSKPASLTGMKMAPKAVQSKMDTVEVTHEVLRGWKLPPFQRPLRVNEKVRTLAEELKCNGEIIPGVITLGILGKECFIVDGQHRLEAFKQSGLTAAYADVRICQFESMAEMGEAFVQMQSPLVRMRPDDVLRGLEGVIDALGIIRKHCDFIGYDMIRRGTASPVVSMASVLRAWSGSVPDVPSPGTAPVVQLARGLTDSEAHAIVQFMNVAVGAWGRDPEYYRLWGALNVGMTMWLWRRTVVSQYSHKSTRMTAMQFGKCLMAMSSDGNYLDWLVGRMMTDRDRSPCYGRIKGIFARRLAEDGIKAVLPAPAWSSHIRGQ